MGLWHKYCNVSGVEIYSGYVDDPRNTDNAWMETVAFNFHQDDLLGVLYSVQLHAGDDAKAVKWQDISSRMSLYASHEDMIEKVAQRHKAHWWVVSREPLCCSQLLSWGSVSLLTSFDKQ